MINQNLNFFNKKLLKGFFANGFSMIISSFALLVLVAIYFFMLRKPELIIYPQLNEFKPLFYNDSVDNGKTEITKTTISDSVVCMQFILKDGFIRPYAGIGFEKPLMKEFDLSAYNRMKVVLSGKRIQPIFVYLVLKDSSMSFEGNVLGFRHLCQYIEIDEQPKEFILKRNNFETPDWWFDKYNLSPAKISTPNWDRAFRLSITTGLTPLQNQEMTITVYEIKMYRDNRFVAFLMIIAQLIIIFGLFIWYYLQNTPRKNSITINYQAINPQQKQDDKVDFLEFINRNFQNSELSLQLISKNTGINQRKIAETIAIQFNCNVKTYINQIRINEARRLLKETDLNISEVAYSVGFSSPSNFNRVFKSFVGKSPSEFLQSLQS